MRLRLLIPTYQVARILLSSRVPKQDTIIIIIIIKNQLEQKTLIKHEYFDRFYNPKKQDKLRTSTDQTKRKNPKQPTLEQICLSMFFCFVFVFFVSLYLSREGQEVAMVEAEHQGD